MNLISFTPGLGADTPLGRSRQAIDGSLAALAKYDATGTTAAGDNLSILRDVKHRTVHDETLMSTLKNDLDRAAQAASRAGDDASAVALRTAGRHADASMNALFEESWYDDYATVRRNPDVSGGVAELRLAKSQVETVVDSLRQRMHVNLARGSAALAIAGLVGAGVWAGTREG